MRPLNDSEIAQVAARLGVRDRAFFVLGIRTGFRVSELLSLRIADVVHGGEVARFVGVQRRNMKGKVEGRTIPLHDEARAALAPWVAEIAARGAAAESPLFLSREGGAISRGQAWAILNGAYRAAGVFGRVGVHGLRKTFAARVYDRTGRDLMQTQKALGHKAITSTVAYLSFAESEVNAAILAA
jgi:type 1 fimbriae regulatory protein FimE